MKETIKKAFLWALVFLGTILFWFIWYSSRTNLSTQNNGDTITSSIWNNVINNINDLNTRISNTSIPSWAVMAFNLSACPTWWNAANWSNWTPDLRWEFIRGWDNWKWVDNGRVLGSWQNEDFKAHTHDTTLWLNVSTWTPYYAARWANAWSNDNQWNRTISSSLTWWVETRPRNVALLYCIKN